jgi:hypothetical protein
MNEWNIQTRAHVCQSCGKAFHHKQSYHTLLFDEKSDFVRLDVCAGCWQQQYSQGASDRKGFVSHWQGIYEVPPATAPEPIQKENAESLLRKLIELNDPKFVPAAYILAVMLERKRLLKVKEQLTRDAQRVFVYEQPKTGDLFTITDPNLQLNQLEEVQRNVATLLEHGLPAPPAPEAPSPVAIDPSQPPVEGTTQLAESPIESLNRLPSLPLPEGEGRGEGEGADQLPTGSLSPLNTVSGEAVREVPVH